MNIFDEFFNILSRNKTIFEKYSSDSQLGIYTDDLFETRLKKTGRELIQNKNVINRIFDLRSVECYNLINLPLIQYTYGE